MEIEWKVEKVDCVPDVNGSKNVAQTVHWRCWGKDGDFTDSNYGTVNIAFDPNGKFTPFDKLKEATVIGWVKDALEAERVKDIEAGLARAIEFQKNPPVVSPALPWAPKG